MRKAGNDTTRNHGNQLAELRKMRAEAVEAIDRLIALVNGIDGDPDLEPDADLEPLFCDLRGGTLRGDHRHG